MPCTSLRGDRIHDTTSFLLLPYVSKVAHQADIPI